MDKISLRSPKEEDLKLAAQDLYTMRAAPPLLVTLSVVYLLVGNAFMALASVLVTSYISALWTRLLEPKASAG